MGQRNSKSSDGADSAPSNVVSASMPAPKASSTIGNKVALGAGCYWGTEKFVRKDFQKRFPGSIKTAKVGFMSPDSSPRIKNPTYQQVCTGRSGHVEVLLVELNDPQAHFEELIRFFFTFHDPTTKNRQGNDTGFQYASFIFCQDDEQAQIAQRVRAELQTYLDSNPWKRPFDNKKITTKIGPLMEFTKAEEYHQRYLEMDPNGYCNHRIRIKQWPAVKAKTQAREEAPSEAQNVRAS